MHNISKSKRTFFPFFLKNRSIARELTISLAIMISIIQISVFVYVYSHRSKILIATNEIFISDYSEKLKGVLAVPMWDFDYEQINIIGSGYMSNQLVSSLTISDFENNIIFDDARNQNVSKNISRKIDIFYRDSKVGHAEISISLASYYDSLSRMRNVTAGSIIISLAVIFTVTGILLRIIMRKSFSIFELGMDRVADGDFGYNIETNIHIELAGIADRFNEMAEKIRVRENALQLVNVELLEEVKARKKTESDLIEREMDLKKLNEDLEKRVYLRTKELTNTNKELENEIKEHEQTESALINSKAEADAANRTKSRFLANMSHEIRTPMNGVLGMSELLMDTGLSTLQEEYVRAIKTSGDSLLSIINDILDFSKIEAGKLELDPVNFSLRSLISDILNLIRNRVYAKKIDLIIDISSRVPDLYYGDSGRLNQILLNLINNALKFTEEGEIVVKIKTLKQSKDSVELLFNIQDTGIGISEDRLNKIFKSFEQADGSTTRKFGGSGLGLSISEQLVKLMKGKIWVESTLYQGSAFYFKLTFDVPERSDVSDIDYTDYDFNDMNIMISDSNARSVHTLHEMLKSWNVNVINVKSSSEADVYLDRNHVSLVILDIQEIQSGWEKLLLKIKENSPKTHVLVTGSVDRSFFISLSEKLKISHYIQKPFVSLDLLKEICDVTGIKEKQHVKLTDDFSHIKLKNSTPYNILLVEDTLINQKVAVQMLSMLGHTVTVAQNGYEALDRVKNNDFHVIMMDIQMPEMDGVEATFKIREFEKEKGVRTPIIAMTAHAMKGDRERFIQSGMDGYISKPINPTSLFEALESDTLPFQKLNNTRDMTKDELVSDISIDRNSPIIINWDELLDKLSGDNHLLEQVITVFLGEFPDQLKAISEALRKRDYSELASCAHTFKGAIGNFETGPVFNAALNVELSSKDKDLAGVEKACSVLYDRARDLESVLKEKIKS